MLPFHEFELNLDDKQVVSSTCSSHMEIKNALGKKC